MDKPALDILVPLQIGSIVKGTIKYISKQYLIVNVDSLNCILPTSEMTWNNKPRCKVNMNDDVEAVVVRIEENQVMLSIKRLTSDPWMDIHSRYNVGQRLNVRVVNITNIGVFVELEPGLSGLIHRKQLAFSKVIDPKNYASVDDMIEAEIIEIDDENKKIQLSRLPILINPWDNVEEKYSLGQRLTRRIKDIQDYGVFVELEPGLDALYHRSEMYIPKNTKLKDIYSIGDELTLQISSMDSNNHKIAMKLPVVE